MLIMGWERFNPLILTIFDQVYHHPLNILITCYIRFKKIK